MITNKLYERLKDEGILDSEFPQDKITPLQKAIETLPSTLQESGQKILYALTSKGAFTWNEKNEIIYGGKVCQGSDLNKLLSLYVHGSSKFYNLKCSKVFLSAVKEQGISAPEPLKDVRISKQIGNGNQR